MIELTFYVCNIFRIKIIGILFGYNILFIILFYIYIIKYHLNIFIAFSTDNLYSQFLQQFYINVLIYLLTLGVVGKVNFHLLF